ncbi:MAG: tRNA lysidine(34) synthetase TilS [Clostridia bacterium]|nr:tRNA lysidine(34) synthetase TilS [Clostridia bacterium]
MKADEFSRRLLSECALEPGSHVLVALSGGADSVALLCLFLEVAGQYPISLSCAHVEHGIRGQDSADDLEFVRVLCREKGVALYDTHVDAPAYSLAHGCGMEDAARRLRYAFLNETADAIGAHAIALAHHAGDQRETVLLHALRGCDVKGLCAMRKRSGRLIRPLLDEEPQLLRQYLLSIGQTWREDASNADTAYLRNRIRHHLLPLMEETVPGAGAALGRLSRAAQRDEDYFSAVLDSMRLQEIALVDGVAVSKAALASLHPALCSRALVRLMVHAGIEPQSADVIGAIMAALDGSGATVNLTNGAHAAVGDNNLCLIRPQVETPDTPLNVPGRTMTPFGEFEVSPAASAEIGDGIAAQCMPLRLLEGAYVSARREGDTMIPFGKHTPVKLKKLMIDARIERAMRNSVPVVRDREGAALFAVGLRPAQRCHVTQDEACMMVRFYGPLMR